MPGQCYLLTPFGRLRRLHSYILAGFAEQVKTFRGVQMGLLLG